MSILTVNALVVAVLWYWSLTDTVNVNAVVESVKSLESIVPIRCPSVDKVIPVGREPDVKEYYKNL